MKTDLPIAEFLETHFADRRYSELRRTVTRMVEGYDAADPRRASIFSLRDEWMGRGLGQQGRIVEGYGALIEYLVSECRRHGLDPSRQCRDGHRRELANGLPHVVTTASILEADAAILVSS